jgi:UDP-N-acetylglucosamine enolpyruvyl transferase
MLGAMEVILDVSAEGFLNADSGLVSHVRNGDTLASTSLGRSFLISKGIGSSRFCMFLSGNAEGAFASKTATIAAAMSLPPPAITAATFTVNAAAVVASVMSALTTTVLAVYIIYRGYRDKHCHSIEVRWGAEVPCPGTL